MASSHKPPAIGAPADGRLGWFEGIREDRLRGWTYLAAEPHRTLMVTLGTADGASLTIAADRLRADLQAAGAADGYHGFSAPAEALGGGRRPVSCVWTDLGTALPGSPWSPARRKGSRFRAGPVVLEVDRPLAGDPRLTGSVLDRRDPLRRIRLGASSQGRQVSDTVASLYRAGSAGDGFHGFILALPAPLGMLEEGVELFDAESGLTLTRLGPRSL